jgi:hypothetical protein
LYSPVSDLFWVVGIFGVKHNVETQSQSQILIVITVAVAVVVIVAVAIDPVCLAVAVLLEEYPNIFWGNLRFLRRGVVVLDMYRPCTPRYSSRYWLHGSYREPEPA